jgi:hypothetical protein
MSGLLAAVITELARDVPSWHDALRLLDSTPIPCAASRETAKRSDLAGHAGHGYCASHSRFFWGFRLYLISTADGMPIIWGLANPKLGERQVTQALLERDHHLIGNGQIIVGDKGFAGAVFEAFIHDQLGAHLVRPDRKNEPARHGKLARIRQWIESSTRAKATHPRRPRWAHPGRRLRPSRRPPARTRRRHLAQLAHRRTRQTIPHRLRPLNPFGLTHLTRLRLGPPSFGLVRSL